MQNYTDISPETLVKDSLTAVLDNDKTAISNSSGDAFPATDLLAGMTCYRTDLKKMFVLESIDPVKWAGVANGADPSMTADFTAEVGGNYWLRDSFLVTLPASTGLEIGASVTLSKAHVATPTIQVGAGTATITTSKGSDTSVLFDVDAELVFTFNGVDWEVVLVSGLASLSQQSTAEPASFQLRQYSTSQDTGVVAQETIALSATLQAGSTAVHVASRVITTATVTGDTVQGSSVGARQSVVELYGGGYTDKAVASLVQVNVQGVGRRAAVLGYEYGMPYISNDADIGSVCGFYFPNMESIPNIDRIETLFSFANQHRRAPIQNASVYLDASLREVVAPAHVGMAAGRYYTAPYRAISYSPMAAGVAYLSPIYIPARTKITSIGTALQTGVGGAKLKLAIYSAVKGMVAELKFQSSDISCDVAGNKVATPNVELDGGMYWLLALPSAPMNLATHVAQESGSRVAIFGQSDPMLSDANTEKSAIINIGGYINLPTSVNIVPTYTSVEQEAHIWIQVEG